MTTNQQDSESGQTESVMHSGRTGMAIKHPLTWQNCAELRKKLETKIKEGRNEIILDFKKVDHLDSAALEMLIDVHDVLMKQGGILKIAGINEVCRDILISTRLINILLVYKDMNEATAHKRV
ncbi:MAG: STAS domain-containing protein [Desulfobacterales bacterium]|nr:STAS domain-containing protein [Desulfobacterales bacterium]MDX2512250.1 STAS domain-containing protein [Desulfobacterales bacterium]